jgi:hypothetical protein
MDAIPSAAELASHISAAKQKYIDDGQQIWSTFPEKVVTLHALHSQMSSIAVATGTASRPLGQSNDGISELAEVLKVYLRIFYLSVCFQNLFFTGLEIALFCF